MNDAQFDLLGEWLANADAVQLGQPLAHGAPRWAGHPPFMYSLASRHGDEGHLLPGQDPCISAASDMFAMGLHTGTHIDGLSHIALDGRLCDGTDVAGEGVQGYAEGVAMSVGPNLRPVVAPGVLLDFPTFLDCEVIPGDYIVTPESLIACADRMGVTIDRGSVVLIRTGWDSLWTDPERYLTPAFPGPELEAAQLLSERGVLATGSDTIPYELAPTTRPLAVHAELLSRSGIFIMECLNLAELARRRVHRFLFVALPLRIPTATGSPINPIALVPREGVA